MALSRLLHAILALPAAIGLLALTAGFINAVILPDIANDPVADAAAAWGEILAETVTLSVGTVEYSDIEVPSSDVSDNAGLSEAQRIYYARNNAFMVSCSLLMLGFLVGLSLIEGSLNGPDDWWMPALRNLGVLGFLLPYYFVIGFDVNYPGEFIDGMGFAPLPPRDGPSLIITAETGGSYSYSDGSYTLWCDALNQGLFCVLVGWLVVAVASGLVGRAFAFAMAVAAGFLYPLTTSWKWGGGWLDMMGAYDFSGGMMVHGIAGTVALVALVAARLGGLFGNRLLGDPPGESDMAGSRLRPGGLPFFLLGVLGVLAGIAGVQAGSVLSADAPVVAFVLQTSLLSMICAAVAAGLLGLLSHSRSVTLFALTGAVAGWAAISIGADVVPHWSSVVLGIFSGLLAGLALLGLDALRISDPLGTAAGGLLGGVLGAVATAPFLSGDYFSATAQIPLVVTYPLVAAMAVLPLAIFVGLAGALATLARRPASTAT